MRTALADPYETQLFKRPNQPFAAQPAQLRHP
jgi:hypothetical protein